MMAATVTMLAAGVLALDIHGTSVHLNAEVQYNEQNPGIGVTSYEGRRFYTTGVYRNSHNKESIYVGAGIQKGAFGILAGLASGYPAGIVPILSPRLSIGPLNIYYIPPVSGKYAGPETIMFSTSWPVGGR